MGALLLACGYGYFVLLSPTARLRRDLFEPENWQRLGRYWDKKDSVLWGGQSRIMAGYLSGDSLDRTLLRVLKLRVAPMFHAIGVRDDEEVGRLAAAIDQTGPLMAEYLYRIALDLDSTDGKWPERIAQLESRLWEEYSARLRDEPMDTLSWELFGDGLDRWGSIALAESASAIICLLDPENYRAYRSPDLESAPLLLRAIGLWKDEWVGDLADSARVRGAPEAARALYELALELDPTDSEWLGWIR